MITSETVIKPISLVNKNVIIAGRKEKKKQKKNKKWRLKKMNFSPYFFKIFNFFKIVIIIII